MYDRYEYSSYVDLKGNNVTRTRETHPYGYDAYVIWKGDYVDGQGSSEYSDRLLQWDWDKFNSCSREVWGNEAQYFNNRQPEDIERFLGLYFDKNVKLTALMEGCNVSNGYPYWIFFFEEK
jgi:hypothetical protein